MAALYRFGVSLEQELIDKFDDHMCLTIAIPIPRMYF